MGDSVRRGSLYGGLSQLKQFFKKYPFFFKKGFSGFAVLFFGLAGAGTFPSLPEIDTKDLAVSEEKIPVAEGASSVAYERELCLWQRDFSFFSDLELEKRASQEATPCPEVKEKAAVVVAVDENEGPSEKEEGLDREIRELAAGYPLEVMAPAIAEYDRDVAALIVGIAKKESNWGKRVPVDAAGKDCFNYWGFKGAGTRGVAMGHGCFGSPEEAVHAVGNRIAQLVDIKKTSEPKNMIIWKCGSSCATHSPESVRKWISDVDIYYRKIAQK